MRKFLTLCLAMVMIMSLTACGGNADKSDPEDSMESGDKSDEDEPAPEQVQLPAHPIEFEPTILSDGTELTQEHLLDYPVSDPADFVIEALDENICSIKGYTGHDEIVVVPETINGHTVVEIGEGGLGGLHTRGIVLPDTVHTLRFNALVNSTMEYIYLGSGLKVSENAFTHNVNLRQLIFPEGMEAFPVDPIGLCPGLVAVVVPASVTTIPGGIFSPTIELGAFLATPEGSAADELAEMEQIPVVRDISEIPTLMSSRPDLTGKNPPAPGAKLTQTILLNYPESDPNRFQYIPINNYMCKITGCTDYGVAEDVIVVPQELDGLHVTAIGERAMSDIDARGIVLPDTVMLLEEIAFLNSTMEYVHLGNGLRSVAHAFVSNPNLKQLIFPEGMRKLYDFAEDCPALKRVTIPGDLLFLYGYLEAGNKKMVVVTPEGSQADEAADDEGLRVERPWS